jgi:hypothetical protein
MTATLTRIADRILAAVAPRVEADASCVYRWQSCYCVYRGPYYAKKCMRGCSQVPDHCYPREYRGPC